jgi:hypothetical protein
MAITTLAMVATVFVGNLYDKKDRPVPEWAQTAFLYYAARLLWLLHRCVDTPLPPGSTSFSSLVDYATEGSSVDGGGQGASPVEKLEMKQLHQNLQFPARRQC